MQIRGRILQSHKLAFSLRVEDHPIPEALSNPLTGVSSHQRQHNGGSIWEGVPESCGVRGASGNGKGSCWIRRTPSSPHLSPFPPTFGTYHSSTREIMKRTRDKERPNSWKILSFFSCVDARIFYFLALSGYFNASLLPSSKSQYAWSSCS